MIFRYKIDFKRVLKGGFIHVLSANLLVTVFSFALQFFVANLLGPVSLGQIKVIQSFFGIATILVNFGFTTVMLKEIPLIRNNKNQKKLLNYVFRQVLLNFIVVYSFIGVGNYFNLFSLDENLKLYLLVYSLGLLPLAFNSISGVYLQSLKQFQRNSKIQIISKLTSILVVVMLTWLLGLWGFIAGVLFGLLLTSLFYLTSGVNPHCKIPGNSNDFKNIWNTAFYSMLTFLTGKGAVFLDLIIASYLIDSQLSIGYYGFALTLIAGLNVVSGSVQQYFTPYISSKVENILEFKTDLRSKKKKFNLVLLLIAAFCFITVPFVINFVFPKYILSTIFFNVLLISWVLKSAYALNNTGLVALGQVRLCFIQNIISSLFSVGMLIFLVESYGILGAAYARVLTSLLGLLLSSFFYNHTLKTKYGH